MTVVDELSGFWRMLRGLPATEVQARSEFASWEQQIAAFHRLPQPWAIASPDEALSVPAIFRAVTLISNTVGMLNLEVYRDRRLLTEDIPRVVTRPNPFTTPRAFYRDTAFYMATRGEAWWWIAKRDGDGIPLSLYPIPPWEITVEANPRDRLEPEVKWLSKSIDLDDLRHITYMPDHSGLRGEGPLQKCGAAVSVSVEADNWAANWFSGSLPSIIGETDMDISESEAKALDEQWAEKPGNVPRWLGLGIKVREFGFDPQKAQLVESRRYNDGQAAVMFGIPGSLLEYNMPGSSLTYQNVEGEYTKLVRTCLQPNYLEPIEQEMSDLLTRSTTARFNTNEVLRADIKTRSEVFTNLVGAGVVAEVAAQIVGFETLDPDPASVAPVPLAPPQAIPDRLPPDIRAARSSAEVRCDGCHKLLAETATPPYRMTCPRCKAITQDLQVRSAAPEAPPPSVINVHPAPVTVEAPSITFQRGAFEAPDMSGLGEAIAGLANQKVPDVRVDVAAPDMRGVSEAIAAMADRPQTPTEVHIAQQEPPVVNLPAPVINLPAPIVNLPEQPPAPVVVDTEQFAKALNDLRDEIRAPRTRKIIRDENNVITGVFEESA